MSYYWFHTSNLNLWINNGHGYDWSLPSTQSLNRGDTRIWWWLTLFVIFREIDKSIIVAYISAYIRAFHRNFRFYQLWFLFPRTFIISMLYVFVLNQFWRKAVWARSSGGRWWLWLISDAGYKITSSTYILAIESGCGSFQVFSYGSRFRVWSRINLLMFVRYRGPRIQYSVGLLLTRLLLLYCCGFRCLRLHLLASDLSIDTSECIEHQSVEYTSQRLRS
jgi:hypothetical protein